MQTKKRDATSSFQSIERNQIPTAMRALRHELSVLLLARVREKSHISIRDQFQVDIFFKPKARESACESEILPRTCF